MDVSDRMTAPCARPSGRSWTWGRGRLTAATAACGYVAAVTWWMLETYRVVDGPRTLDSSSASDGTAGMLIGLVAPLLVGIVVGRWWAALLPAVSLVIAVPLTFIVDLDTLPREPLPPIWAALFVVILLGLPAAFVGVVVRLGVDWLRAHGRAAVGRRKES